jgi:hypothetical protein
MKMMRRWPALRSAGLGLALLALGGCQTWVAGMTLPSGRYLQHPPQYIPPSPPFPLPRELSSQEAAAAAALPGGGLVPGGGVAAPLPPALPPAGAGAPPPVP